MLWISSGKLYHLIKEIRMKRKRKGFVKVLEKVKLVLVNIKFRLDISMSVMVTNPGIGFGAWHTRLQLHYSVSRRTSREFKGTENILALLFVAPASKFPAPHCNCTRASRSKHNKTMVELRHGPCHCFQTIHFIYGVFD